MKKVLFFTNLPSPYRIEFFNDLGVYVELTVIFEGRRSPGIRFNWNDNQIKFKAIFLKDEIIEKRVNRKIFKYIQQKDYDYIFFTNYGFYTELAGIILAKIKRIPYVLEFDGAIYKTESAFKRYLKSVIIKGAMCYFSPNQLTDEVLAHYGVERKRIYRYPFSSVREKDIREKIVCEKEREEIKKELGIKEVRTIICVGRFIHIKGIDILIRAVAGIPSNIGVYVVGGKATEEYIKMVERYNIENIHFVGFQDNETLKKYYDMADLFVLPTRGDVWGLVINEAMARGLPIITTDNCGAGLEMIQDNGVIVHTESSDEITREINKVILDREKLDTMSKKSLEISRKYTIENMVKRHLNYFETIPFG